MVEVAVAVSPEGKVFSTCLDQIWLPNGTQIGETYWNADPSPSQFASLLSIAVSRKYVFACDCGHAQIQVFRHDGSWVRALGCVFDRPIQVEVLHDDVVIVHETGVKKALRIVDTSGRQDTRTLRVGTLFGFAVGAEELYVHRFFEPVAVFDFEGVLLRNLPQIHSLLVGIARDYLLVTIGDRDVALRLDGSLAFEQSCTRETYAVGPLRTCVNDSALAPLDARAGWRKQM